MKKPYHYKNCGLDYVYLLNGYEIHNTPYGQAISIDDALALHQTIVRDVISSPRPFRGQEVRFLRSELDLSQSDLAKILGTSRPTIARWESENRKEIPGAADRALRLFCALQLMGHKAAQYVLEVLKELDEQEYGKMLLKETAHGWESRQTA